MGNVTRGSAGRRSTLSAVPSILRRPLVASLCFVLLAAACSSDDAPSTEIVGQGAAVTIAALPTGEFLWATQDGDVLDADGTVLATVDAVTDGQRGLLGLTVDDDERIFVSYTDPTFDIVVSELVTLDGVITERPVWRGPKTVQGGNGGRMIVDDGELIIGIGLLNDRDGQADPGSIVGKIIAIDADGSPETQEPRILSGPWNNPFAFDRADSGELWVADNHPRDGDERVARGDTGLDPEVALVLPADSAPSGLAATATELFVCSYNDLELNRYEIADGVVTFAETLADDCLLDVELLSSGDLVYSTGSSLVRIDRGG